MYYDVFYTYCSNKINVILSICVPIKYPSLSVQCVPLIQKTKSHACIQVIFLVKMFRCQVLIIDHFD